MCVPVYRTGGAISSTVSGRLRAVVRIGLAREPARLVWLPVLLFGSICAALWAFGNGIPYGYDSLENYFTYLVAYNAATFSQVNPLMADIAASPDPASHPFYYSHNPNLFAHLLSQLLIRVGIASLAAHDAFAIAVSVFGLFLAVRVLSRIGGPVLCMTAVALFALDYVGILTWSTNLLRSMHFPLFWGNLYLLQWYLDRPSRLRLFAAAAGLAVVFLNDLTLAPFVLLSESFLIWQTNNSVAFRLRFTGALLVGATVAATTWAAVLMATLGPAVVLQDTIFTFLGRNASELLNSPSSITNFYRTNNLVFWGHEVDTSNRWQLIVSAYREMFRLGQGALALLVYPLLLFELLRALLSRAPWLRRVHRWPTSLSLVGVLTLSTAAALWADASSSLFSEWDLVPGSNLVRDAVWL